MEISLLSKGEDIIRYDVVFGDRHYLALVDEEVTSNNLENTKKYVIELYSGETLVDQIALYVVTPELSEVRYAFEKNLPGHLRAFAVFLVSAYIVDREELEISNLLVAKVEESSLLFNDLEAHHG